MWLVTGSPAVTRRGNCSFKASSELLLAWAQARQPVGALTELTAPGWSLAGHLSQLKLSHFANSLQRGHLTSGERRSESPCSAASGDVLWGSHPGQPRALPGLPRPWPAAAELFVPSFWPMSTADPSWVSLPPGTSDSVCGRFGLSQQEGLLASSK